MNPSQDDIPTVFIRFKDIPFRLTCPECKHEGMIGHNDLNIMYYVYLSAQLMKFNVATRTIRLKSKTGNIKMFETVLNLLDRSAIGWEVFDKKVEKSPSLKDPTKEEEHLVCYLRRITR